MENTLDVVEVFAINGKFGVKIFTNQHSGFTEGHIFLNSSNFCARNHDLANNQFPEIKNRREHLALGLLNHAFGIGTRDDIFEFFGGVNGVVAGSTL